MSAGTTDEATVTITDDDVPSVTVSFGSAAYTVAESDDSDTTDVTENTVEVTLTLSADPERTVVIPIEKIQPGRRHHRRLLRRATERDLRQRRHLPRNTFTFTAETDTVDDDGESVKLSFGATLPDGVSDTGRRRMKATVTITITDDDVPSVTVSFGSDAYTGGLSLDADPERTVATLGCLTFDAGDTSKSFDLSESDDSDTTDVTENTVEVTLTLSADPERTVVIPIEKTNQGGHHRRLHRRATERDLRQRRHLRILHIHRRDPTPSTTTARVSS